MIRPRKLFAVAALILSGCNQKPEYRKYETCAAYDVEGRRACFDNCADRNARSDEGEDVIYACDATCAKLYCIAYKTVCTTSKDDWLTEVPCPKAVVK